MTSPEAFKSRNGDYPIATGLAPSAEPSRFAQSDEAHGHARPHFKTAGEKRFNWQTYTNLGYFANVGISLGAVFWAERTKSGQGFIRGFGKMFEKVGLAAEKAEFFGRKSFFLAGGFAVIPFMKHREDHKAELVKQYNREIYGKQAETDPLIKESEREVEQAPPQGWRSIITGRALALVPFYATTMLLWSNTSAISRMTNPELAALGKAGRKAMQHDRPVEFAALASKGWFFDKPLAHLTRDFGKLISSKGKYFDTAPKAATGLGELYQGTLRLTGKLMRWAPEDAKAVRQIEEMERRSPAAIQSVKAGEHFDPIQATMPYYFISEAITSAMVAWGLYVITRVTGPFFGKEHKTAELAPAALMEAPAPVAQGPASRVAALKPEGRIEETPALANGLVR